MNISIYDSIIGIIKKNCGIKIDYVLEPTTELSEIPEWSSIMYVMLLAEIEAKYSMKLSGDDLFDVETIEDLAELINSTLSK